MQGDLLVTIVVPELATWGRMALYGLTDAQANRLITGLSDQSIESRILITVTQRDSRKGESNGIR